MSANDILETNGSEWRRNADLQNLSGGEAMPEKNIELLKRLRTRFLRMRHKKHFYMGSVVEKNECGTAMCIAGHALALEGYKFTPDGYGEFEWFTPDGRKEVEPLDEAQKLLGLTANEAQWVDEDEVHRANGLFYRFDLKTPKQAAKLITRIIETGKVLETDSNAPSTP